MIAKLSSLNIGGPVLAASTLFILAGLNCAAQAFRARDTDGSLIWLEALAGFCLLSMPVALLWIGGAYA